jgi:hypothetical protein
MWLWNHIYRANMYTQSIDIHINNNKRLKYSYSIHRLRATFLPTELFDVESYAKSGDLLS